MINFPTHARSVYLLRGNHDLAWHIGHAVFVLQKLGDEEIHSGGGPVIATFGAPRNTGDMVMVAAQMARAVS